jgi:hypothetical protein
MPPLQAGGEAGLLPRASLLLACLAALRTALLAPGVGVPSLSAWRGGEAALLAAALLERQGLDPLPLPELERVVEVVAEWQVGACGGARGWVYKKRSKAFGCHCAWGTCGMGLSRSGLGAALQPARGVRSTSVVAQ